MHRHLLAAAVFFASAYSTFALVGTPPVLANAVRLGDQFQFTLRGQTNVTYIIESSSDLRTWTLAATNSDPHATRTVVVPAVPSTAFWRIRRAPEPLFSRAIAARGTINLSGGTGLIDSFDSADTNYSTAGQYDRAKRKAGGHIGSGSGVGGTVNIGNMEVAGVVSTEPRATVRIGPAGGVGSLAWLSNYANRGTIEPGYVREDMNLAFTPATLPTNFGPVMILAPGSYVVGGTNYKYAILVDGDYRISSISVGPGEKMLINATCRLLVEASTTVSGTGNILLGPDATIEWYAGGGVSLGGGGCINTSGLAHRFSIVGLTPWPVSYIGGTPLVGTIYAPLSTVTLAGTTDLIGAVVCNNFTLSGGMGIHFDENLMRVGPWR